MENIVGRNKFAAYQEEKQRRRIGLIENRLSTLSTLRIQFLNITQLAETVAQYISEKEIEAGLGVCSASTLLRNLHYKALLVAHLENHGREGGRHVKNSHLVNVGDDTRHIQVQLRCVNLENENARLKAYISQMERKISQEGYLLPAEQVVHDHEKAFAAVKNDYAQTCKTLLLLLRRFESYAAVDRETNSIVDSAIKRGNGRIIAGPEQAGAFCRWLDLNPFPMVGAG